MLLYADDALLYAAADEALLCSAESVLMKPQSGGSVRGVGASSPLLGFSEPDSVTCTEIIFHLPQLQNDPFIDSGY